MPKIKQARPAATVCTCLQFRKAARRVSQIYDRSLAPYGLTITQYGLLGHIRSHDGTGISALADLLIMDPTTLTRNLQPLLKQSLVVLAEDQRDRRHRNLHLTAAGREAFVRARGGWEAAQKKVAAAMGEADGPLLAGAIEKLLENLAG